MAMSNGTMNKGSRGSRRKRRDLSSAAFDRASTISDCRERSRQACATSSAARIEASPPGCSAMAGEGVFSSSITYPVGTANRRPTQLGRRSGLELRCSCFRCYRGRPRGRKNTARRRPRAYPRSRDDGDDPPPAPAWLLGEDLAPAQRRFASPRDALVHEPGQVSRASAHRHGPRRAVPGRCR